MRNIKEALFSVHYAHIGQGFFENAVDKSICYRQMMAEFLWADVNSINLKRNK